MDGLGGSVKRSVWRHRSGQAHIPTAEQYTSVAKERNPNVLIHFIPKSSIDKMNAFLDAKWEGVVAVPQTHKMHCFIPHGKDTVMVADTYDATEFKVVSIRKVVTTISAPQLIVNETITENNTTSEEPRSISVGQWVVVHYDGMRYPGEVTDIDGGENQYEVRVMHRSGNHWKWPVTDDKIFYSHEDIKNNIDPPRVAGHCGQFTFVMKFSLSKDINIVFDIEVALNHICFISTIYLFNCSCCTVHAYWKNILCVYSTLLQQNIQRFQLMFSFPKALCFS